MNRMITKSMHRSLQKQLAQSQKDKERVRRAALEAITSARSEGNLGRLVLTREDQCGAYVMARWDLAQRRTQLRDIQVY